jgi:hypothetical protein
VSAISVGLDFFSHEKVHQRFPDDGVLVPQILNHKFSSGRRELVSSQVRAGLKSALAERTK